jgi:hypothetical protein
MCGSLLNEYRTLPRHSHIADLWNFTLSTLHSNAAVRPADVTAISSVPSSLVVPHGMAQQMEARYIFPCAYLQKHYYMKYGLADV